MASKNVMDTLRERGFIKQTVYEEELYKLLGDESVTFYIGFDPTADSLHVGHFVQLMAMAHMQRAGHRPIALIGGGTALVGDPSGRTDMRTMMTCDSVASNCECCKKQMQKFIDFSDNKALMVNNAEWLAELNYIDFLREIGTCFSVNKMLTAECFKKRLEKGLSFLEFNYMLMQSYDFLVLYRRYGCLLQLGGDDQWNNMLGGADLIRRKEQKNAYAMTFALLTTSDGVKMGKTAKGAVWLSPHKTSPYEFFQYWRNINDEDTQKCLKLLTFVELDEINELCRYRDERINAAKVRLAYEVTALVHGKDVADEVKAQAEAAFTNNTEEMREVSVLSDNIVDVLVEIGFAKSKSDARRLIDGGGVSVDETKINLCDYILPQECVLHKGKKAHIKVIKK